MAQQSFRHEGFCVGPVTPMEPNGDVRLESIQAYSDHLLASGVNGLFLNGTCAEGLSMTVAERKSLAEKWISVGRGKYDKIIVHCGALSLRDARELATHAEAIGADAISAVPSFYFVPHDERTNESHRGVGVSGPQNSLIYYHNPGRTHVSVDMALFIPTRKDPHPHFCRHQMAASDLAGLLRCKALHGDSIALMWANDDHSRRLQAWDTAGAAREHYLKTVWIQRMDERKTMAAASQGNPGVPDWHPHWSGAFAASSADRCGY
ncbi:putative N-acetylneuraminate lyase [Hypsibius exemplaris]|uniref:N-acetylneuraminate lyase n=1 Tax=Hypsibius exemplaris TaxID=2072580 RepID=A0A1W0X3W0_HYPEX|nr:putative N-acetylneuraminate lyase [Hypsibius exemplaris]